MHTSTLEEMSGALEQGVQQACAKGASAAKIDVARWDSTGCSFENGRLKETEAARSLTFDIEVVASGKRVSVTANDPADLSEMMDRAVTLARMGSAAHFSGYPTPASVTPVRIHSERTAALTREQMIEGCQAIVGALKAYDPDLFIQAGSGRTELELLLVTSGGVRHHSRGTYWHLGGGVQRTRGTDMFFSGYGRGWRELNELWDPAWISGRVLDDLRNGETITDAPAGKTTVLIPPEALQMFLTPLTMGVNGRNVAKGDSPLRGRIGEQLLDPCLTLVDNPHLDYASGSREMDCDGVPTRVMTLFRNGVLESFLYDLDTAGMAGADPTGNIGCGPYYLEVPPGSETSETLLAGIEDGLLVKGLIGFGQSNLMNGDVAGNVALGFRIRNGKLVGRVKNTMVACNIYEVLRQNVRLSSDRDPVNHMPWAAIEGANVSAV